MNYIKLKRNKIDFCNICGKKEKLTWDHVPPKIAGNNTTINVNEFFSGVPTTEHYQKRYQSGIKYRTICGTCNNTVLGKYDRAYGKFVKELSNIIESKIILPSKIRIPVEINKVCRAICGHFLAAKDFYDDANIVDIELRKFVLDPSYIMVKNIKIYYWVYPYTTISIIRDVAVNNMFSNNLLPKNMVSGISSYPIALLLDSDSDSQCGLDNLMDYVTEKIDDIVEIEIDLEKSYYPGTELVRHYLWPFNITDDQNGASFVLGNGDTMHGSRLGIKINR